MLTTCTDMSSSGNKLMSFIVKLKTQSEMVSQLKVDQSNPARDASSLGISPSQARQFVCTPHRQIVVVASWVKKSLYAAA